MISVESSAVLAPIREAASLDHSTFTQELRDLPVVLAGAGILGGRTLAGLRSVGVRPVAFADNNSTLWGRQVESIDVLRPEDAARRFGTNGIFVITTWRPIGSGIAGLCRQFRGLGCRNVTTFPSVYWAFPDTFLPYYLWDRPSNLASQWGEIERAFELFADDESRNEFAAHLSLRASASFDALPSLQLHAQYFPDFILPSDREHFVDCGAYNGDTISTFLAWTDGHFERISAFEADPACHADLMRFATARPEIQAKLDCHRGAVTSRSGFVAFNAEGKASSGISARGGIEVPAVRLDEILASQNPTFIKMDIEGAEMDALAGAADTIQRCNPILAICVYHAQDHLWRVPLFIRRHFSCARLFLRSYCVDGLDAVCYAVPEHRLASEGERK